MHRTVITGMGIVSTLGVGPDAVLDSFKNNRCGVVYDQSRVDRGFQSGLRMDVKYDGSDLDIPRQYKKMMPPFCLWAYRAALDALTDAELPESAYRHTDDFCLIHSCGGGREDIVDNNDILKAKGKTSALRIKHYFRSSINNVPILFSKLLGIYGGWSMVSGECSGSMLALKHGMDRITLGEKKIVMVGAGEEISWAALALHFDSFGALSTRNDSPDQALRPFDVNRDGTVLGGGAGYLILEELEHARQRGAKIYGEVKSLTINSSDRDIMLLDENRVADNMAACLEKCGLARESINFVSAHGTSTVKGDDVEAEAISRIFGGTDTPVVSFKGYTGHELSACGIMAAIYSFTCLNNNYIPANRNLTETGDAGQSLNLIKDPASFNKTDYNFLVNTSGFGNINTTTIIGSL